MPSTNRVFLTLAGLLLVACDDGAESLLMQPTAAGATAVATATAQAGAPAAAMPRPVSSDTSPSTSPSATPPASPTGAAGRAAPAVDGGSGGAGAAATPPVAVAGMPAAGSGVMPPAADGCKLPDTYSNAIRLEVEITWPESIALEAGTGMLRAWAKATFQKQADGTHQIEMQPCGMSIPSVKTTPLIGGLLLGLEVPTRAFDDPGFPLSRGTLRQGADLLEIDPGPTVFGAMLADPNAAWPRGTALVLKDDDGDQKPGITALAMRGAEFVKVPTNVTQTEFIDEVYLASRLRLRATRAASECTMDAVRIEPIGFDFSLVGCHVEGRDACTDSEVRFLTNQSPKFMLGTKAGWAEREIAADASCADVRAVFPSP